MAFHIGVALDSFGGHPAVVAPAFDPARYRARAQAAEAAGATFVVLDDRFVLDDSAAAGGACPDALLVMARLAPHTERVGLIASVNTTHTEPFHIAKNIATLDWVSHGRAGWRPTVTDDPAEYALFGRREPAPAAELWDEAAEVVDVVGRLCDSWEDGAIIRDVATGRYVDREKLHYVDFVGRFFSVRGPSITPRSPQGQPLVCIDASDACTDALAARWADVVFVEGRTPEEAAVRLGEVDTALARCGRAREAVAVFARVEVLFAPDATRAAVELAGLDEQERWVPTNRWRFVGDADAFAAEAQRWLAAGVDGLMLHPARVDTDLDRLASSVGPRLTASGLVAPPTGVTLRDRLGFPRPANRYATTGAAS